MPAANTTMHSLTNWSKRIGEAIKFSIAIIQLLGSVLRALWLCNFPKRPQKLVLLCPSMDHIRVYTPHPLNMTITAHPIRHTCAIERLLCVACCIVSPDLCTCLPPMELPELDGTDPAR